MPDWARVLIGSLALMIGSAIGPSLVVMGPALLSGPTPYQYRTPGNQAAQRYQQSAQYRTTDAAENAAGHGDSKTNNEPHEGDPELTRATWALVIATIALVIVAAVQAGMFVWQLVLMRQGVDDAKTAADAATNAAAAANVQATELKRSADATERAVTEFERPWLFVEGAQVSLRDTNVINSWMIRLTLRNYGRTPALVQGAIFKIGDKDTLPGMPDYSNSSPLSIRGTISPRKKGKTSTVGPGPGRQGQLVFYGRITYNELNGAEHHTGFALEVAPAMAAFVRHPNPAYDYYD